MSRSHKRAFGWSGVLGLLAFAAYLAHPLAAQQSGGNRVSAGQCRVYLVHEVHQASQRSGVLAYVASAGSYVKAGSVVASLRDTVPRAALAIAEKEAANDIEVRFARKAAELAQLKYERSLQANRVLDGTVTEFEIRELRLAAQKTLLQLEQAEHQFAVAGLRHAEQREQFAELQIKAPFDAFVRLVHHQPGEYVAEGEGVLEIVNTDSVRIEGYLETADLPRVIAGCPVEVRLDAADVAARSRTFRGEVVFVDVKVEPVSQKVRVTAEVNNHDHLLREGLTVTMTIQPR